MSEKVIIRDFASFQQLAGDCSSARVEFFYAELALDIIECATAEELLLALRPRLSEDQAKTVVGILLDAGLTFDSTLDGEVTDAR